MNRFMQQVITCFVFGQLFVMAESVAAQDVIEFLSGVSSEGKVVKILKSEQKVIFESKLANRTARRTYPYAKIHAVEYNGKRYVLNERPATDDQTVRRGAKEIASLIERVGSTPPDWLASTPLARYARPDMADARTGAMEQSQERGAAHLGSSQSE